MADKFPFAFDFNAMTDALKMPAFEKFMPKDMPSFDFAAIQDAQQKNVAALVEANKAAYAGYSAVAKRQTELFEAAIALQIPWVNAISYGIEMEDLATTKRVIDQLTARLEEERELVL